MTPITIPNITIPTIGIPTIGIPSVGFPSASGGGGLVWPAGMKEHIKAWYDPKKQGMTNYDVIESYVEDFTKSTFNKNNGTATVSGQKINITNIINIHKSIVSIPLTSNNYYIMLHVWGITTDKQIRITVNHPTKAYEFFYPTNGINKIPLYNITNTMGIEGVVAGECNITITQLPTSILKDLSGNGNHAYLYGGKGKLNSGMGLYTYDYNSDRWSSTGRADYIITKKGFEFTNIIEDGGIIFALGSNIAKEGDKVKVKISGIPNGGMVYFGTWITATEDGEYLGTYAYDNNGNTTIGTLGCIGATITLEFIPDYPNQLCYDGKMYAVCYGFPILTDYTVMAERTWFENEGNRVFITKGNIWPNCAFVFEKINASLGSETFSFSKSTNIDDLIGKSGITYQTKQSYNGKIIGVGTSSDGDILLIGGQLKGEYIGCHGKIIIADRSFTEDEITWLKDNWKKI